MSKQAYLTALSVVACLFVAAACAGPPTEAMDAAQAKLDGALEAEIDKYAPAEYETATAEFQKAQAHMEDGEYGEAKTAAENTIALVDAASEESAVQKELIKREVIDGIQAFRDRWGEISESIEAGRNRNARDLAREAREYVESINPQLVELNSAEKWYDLKVLLEEANKKADDFAGRAGG